MLFRATRGLVGHENTRRWMVRCYKRLATSLPFLKFGEIFLYYHILRVRAIPTLESTDSMIKRDRSVHIYIYIQTLAQNRTAVIKISCLTMLRN